jgi:hypothetical protein
MDWVQLLERFGLPTVYALAMAWFGWQVFRWLADKVAAPFLASHFQMMETNTRILAALDDKITAHGKVEERQLEILEKIEDRQNHQYVATESESKLNQNRHETLIEQIEKLELKFKGAR